MDNQPPAPPSQQSATTPDKTPSQTDADSLIQKIETPIQEQKPDQNDARANSENAVSPPANKPREKAKWTDIAVVILTIGIVIWAGLQWWEMHDAGTQTDKIIAADERMAKAMENSVKAAGNSLDASIEQFHRDERAWMTVDHVVGRPEVGQPFVIHIGIRNTGKTPAIHVATHYHAIYLKRGDKPDFHYWKLHSKGSVGLFAPNAFDDVAADTSSGRPLLQSALDALKSGQVVLYVYGRVTYDDVFHRHHWMTFCSYLSPDTQSYINCQEYNDTDTD